MKLKAYLAEIDMTAKDFSELVGIKGAYLSGIMHGKVKPSKRLAKSIQDMTDGKVIMLEPEPVEEVQKTG